MFISLKSLVVESVLNLSDGLHQHLWSYTRRPVKCSKCDQIVKDIKMHMPSCHSDKKVTCKLCSSVFKSKRYLNVHVIYKNTNPDRYKCPRCCYCFSHRNVLINLKKMYIYHPKYWIFRNKSDSAPTNGEEGAVIWLLNVRI